MIHFVNLPAPRLDTFIQCKGLNQTSTIFQFDGFNSLVFAKCLKQIHY